LAMIFCASRLAALDRPAPFSLEGFRHACSDADIILIESDRCRTAFLTVSGQQMIILNRRESPAVLREMREMVEQLTAAGGVL
jgi:hypothetical protein